MSSSAKQGTAQSAVQRSAVAFPRHRRAMLLGAAVLTIIAGLAVSTLFSGLIADAVADALYTILLYLLVAAIAPRLSALLVAATAFAASALIEFSQLTGIPAALSEIVPASRLIFGTTFVATDLLFYVLGAGAAAAIDSALTRRSRRR